jgi:AraC-like DNA-binding protein
MSPDAKQDQVGKALVYSEVAVAPAIAEVVQCGWSFVASDHLQGVYAHHVLPDGCISLVYRAGRNQIPGLLILSGPRVRELRVEMRAGDQFWGLKFWPDAGGVVLGLDPIALREHAGILAMKAPELARSLAPSLDQCRDIEQALAVFHDFVSARKSHCPPIDQLVREAINTIQRSDGDLSISAVADSVGLSLRQLQRRFRARVGLTPKEFARIRRMRVALCNVLEDRPKDWATVAAESGYADQAHFSRDAAALTGLSPAGFEDRIRAIDHQNVDP